MADKTPVRVVFNASNVATGLAEFQTGETVPIASGGTGLSSIGSAGQVLKVNAAGNALEFGAEGDISITNLVAPTNADLTFTTSGTGNIVLDSITVRGTTLSSSDSSSININEGLIVDGTINVSGAATLSGLTYPTSDGSTGQFLKTDGSGTLSFANLSLGDLTIVGSTITTPSNADFILDPSGTGKVNINGAYTLPSTDGSANQFLKTDGSGSLSFADLSLGDLTIIGSTISVPSNADLTLDPSGSGSIKLNANTDITGNLTVSGTLDLGDSNFTNVGSIQLDSISGDGDTNTSITFSGSDVITIATGGSGRLTIGDGALSPVTTNQIDLGTASLEYKDAFFDGTVTTDAITVSGTSALAETTITTTTTGDSLLVTTTEDSNSAAPVITLKRNSSSPADADYLGRIKFKGENDADQEVQYGSISGKILDAADGTEDGAIEFNLKKAGSNNIAMRLNSDELKLLNSTSLDVDGSGTFAGAVTATSVTTNDIVSNGSNADINITPAGTGGVVITSGGVAFTLPTADGNSGDVLKTNGSGTLTFASSTSTPSDDTRVVIKNNKSVGTSARTVDYFQSTSADMAWYFIALSDLTNDHSSASCFAVAHNNSDAFISGARGGASGSDNSLPTTSADISSGQVRVKITAPSADSKISYYKIPISRANTADATAGVTVTTSNTDVDSASESIDTFAHASFRAAKYLIIIDDNAKTETGVTEALVVHDGTTAFVSQYGTTNTGNNDMITLSAAISGSNVVLSAAGLSPNLSLKIHKTLLSDSMTAVSNANQKIIAATTVSSSATSFDSFDLDDATAAMYYVVGGNSTEGHYSVQEVYCAGAPGEASVSQGPFVSTKGTVQLNFTAAFDANEDNTLEMSVSSTSGGSTTVNAYRINCLAE